MIQQTQQQENVLHRLGISTNVLENTDRPIVRIIVEGNVGSGKTALVSMIQQLLEDKVKVVIDDEYTKNELAINNASDNDATLKLYGPIVAIQERLNPRP